jgi:hypothetical protein
VRSDFRTRMAGAKLPCDNRSPPFLAWVALGVGWDILLVSEYFDEEGEPLASNPNRERARLCALLGVVKTIGEVIVAALMYP